MSAGWISFVTVKDRSEITSLGPLVLSERMGRLTTRVSVQYPKATTAEIPDE
jgi:hypothetical protein